MGAKKKICLGKGLGALGHQEKCFYFYFLELVNMFVPHGSLSLLV